MGLVLLAVALANAGTHVSTFEVDPSYTKGDFSGFESLAAEPPVAADKLRAAGAGAVPADAEKVKNAGDASTLVYTNPASNGAVFVLNGVEIGVIGPYNTVRMAGLPAGPWVASLRFSTGYVRTVVIE